MKLGEMIDAYAWKNKKEAGTQRIEEEVVTRTRKVVKKAWATINSNNSPAIIECQKLCGPKCHPLRLHETRKCAQADVDEIYDPTGIRVIPVTLSYTIPRGAGK